MNTPNIHIIPFEKKYEEQVASLINEIAQEFDQSIFSSSPNKSTIKFDKYWLAIAADVVVGTIALIEIGNNKSVLKNMFVHKKFRGKEYGVSERLLTTATNWCHGQNISTIYLGTMQQFKAAHRFYEKNNFLQVAQSKLPVDFIVNPIDDIFYRKHLKGIRKHNFKYRTGNADDLDQLARLAQVSWSGYKEVLALEHWNNLNKILTNRETFESLLKQSHCIVCETEEHKIIGMAFLVPSGNPTEIYQANWSYIRFVSVDPEFGGQGIGRCLTEKCIQHAKESNVELVALHTSEIMIKAIALYENLGFQILREIDARLGKRYWVYTLDL